MAYQHPRVLPFLFLTEMWERFGFYIVQGLLVLYMTQHFQLSDDASYTISGIFAALVYISPFIGGYLADRLLGFKTAILWGGLFLTLGYATLALSTTLFSFYWGLATIVVGNGLFKPNISSLLGTQYDPKNPKRDSGFTIFYIGINIGVALSGLSGYIQAIYGWPITYGLASAGMVIGLITFSVGVRYLKPQTKHAHPKHFQIGLSCLLLIVIVNFLLGMHRLTNVLLPTSGIALLSLSLVMIMRHRGGERRRLISLCTLILCSIVFWTLFLQLFNSANLYVERLVDKDLWGIPLTTTVFWASESVFIFLLGPLLAWGWQLLGSRNKNPSPFAKFILGILFTSVAFDVLAISTYYPTAQGVSALWVFGAYFLLTVGELMISPVGLSAVTLLAPERLVGMMMGIWFVATGFGGYFAGWIAQLASLPASAVTIAQKLTIYRHAFFVYADFAFCVAAILFLTHKGFQGIIASKLETQKHE